MQRQMTKVLFASSEATPLIKTGGLADISGSLPATLKAMRHAVRLILPAYPQALEQADETRQIATLEIGGCSVTLREGRIPQSGVIVWLVDSPEHFDREGGPYVDTNGIDWPDNAIRFALFCRVVVEVAMGRAGLKWLPDVVHCNDWQTGLVPALLSLEKNRPGTIFSIHNLAYQGSFPYTTFQQLGLPAHFWHYTSLEFYGDMSMLKGGLVYADRITTVSPTYAQEICTPELGYGLDGLLRYRQTHLSGILNGVDYSVWDPSVDPLIEANYSTENLGAKARNKASLQRRVGLEQKANTPLLGVISRFVEQKGIDLILRAVPGFLDAPLQLVMLGSGNRELEQEARALAERYPKQIALTVGYDEKLAHLIEAGADIFLMPSRFEPCGLNQLYSLRYGTLPVVHRTGGLADTVVPTNEESLSSGTATGFTFEHATTEGLKWALQEALTCYNNSDCRKQVMHNAMKQDFSWRQSARQYLAIYREAIQDAASS